ncbi:hypothetical protein TSUD_402960 [Trifolium subterraneum]|uniref:Protease Do-like PDZ domain-containing protein n=1 Tax=Trifolium subterraneum TaxID=3900 RepID=A0A2Z6PCX2_TRISU|nr:hypothetical protein TSUD_402960 [Trifolium subterraneum]
MEIKGEYFSKRDMETWMRNILNVKMAVTLSSYCSMFSVLSSTIKHRHTHNHTPIRCSRTPSNPNSNLNRQKNGAWQKNPLELSSKDERSTGGNMVLASYKPSKKDKDFWMMEDLLKEAESSAIQDSGFLNAVVKVYCTSAAPDYSLPWQKQRQYTTTARQDFEYLNCRIVKVKKRGDDSKYVAKVLARASGCDLALLSVESEEFWRDVKPLKFGRLPHLQDSVTVVGYPLGGDTISVTKGVVSRVEVSSYTHGFTDLLTIQIDAAINPGNSGGPVFNDRGKCIGVAFQGISSEDAENIGYVIPTTVVSHFLTDYEKNGKYTGFPCLGVLAQKLENPALRACLKIKSNEGVLVRGVEPTSGANNVLKEGDVIVSFDDVRVGCEGTVPFRSNERIGFRYLISQKFAGDTAELGIVRAGTSMKVKVILNAQVHLVPFHIDEGQPSYLIIAGLVFTPLSEPLIEEEHEEIGLKLLAKARYSFPKFKGEQIVILSQVIKFNGVQIKNIQHFAHLIDSCKEKYMCFEFEDSYTVVLEREDVIATTITLLDDYGIRSERSPDLREPYVDSLEVEGGQPADQEFGDSPVSNNEVGHDGLFWT